MSTQLTIIIVVALISTASVLIFTLIQKLED